MSPDPQRWKRLSSLFEELVELDRDARAARLVSLAVEDAGLARELRAMLDADDAAEGLLDGRIVDAAPTLMGRIADGIEADAVASDAVTPPFERVGRFRLQRLLGRGGMGEVWLAEASDAGFVQQVALKLLKRGMDSDEIVRRFERERRILAQLHHPNIASFVDGGLAPDGRPWYAMEHVEGVPITEYARQRGLDARERAALLAQVCSTVAYAQTHLVVHRDLKPSNILVDASGQPHVLDFGIAKLLDEADEAELTRTGTRALSPAYAAPEQASGAPVSTATDVFALGIVLYELLTGRLPQQRGAPAEAEAAITIERPSATLRRADATQRAHAYGSAREHPERQARAIRGDLDTIVLTALRREPARRYASAAALGEDLKRWLAAQPITARPDSATYRATRFVQRHRVGVAAAVLVLLSLIGGIGVALWKTAEARAAAVAALASEKKAEEQAGIATAISDFVIRDVIQAANPYRAKLDISLRDALVAAGDRVEQRFAGKPRLNGVVRRELAESLYLAGESEVAEAHARQSLETLDAAFGPGDADAIRTRLMLARMLHVRGDLADARALYDAGLAALPAGAEKRSRLALEVGIAGVDIEEHKEDVGLAALERLIPEAEKEFGLMQEAHKDAIDHQMRGFMQLSRTKDALDLAHRVRVASDAQLGPDDPSTAKWVEREAIVLRVLERFDEALPLARRAYDTARKRLGEDHADTQGARMQLAALLVDMEKGEEAVPLMRQVHAFRLKQYGTDHELTWLASIWLARALQGSGELAQARELFETTRASANRANGADSQDAMPYTQTFGMFLQQTGQYAEAETLRGDILARSFNVFPEGHPNIAMFAWDVAETYASQQKDAELVTLCEQWMPKWEPLFDGDSRIVSVREWLAEAKERLASASR